MNNDIPPPQIPDPNPDPEEGSTDVLYIPYILADAPRLQLEFLTRHTGISEVHRKGIRRWLSDYNVRLLKWIHDYYGPEAVRAADALSRATAQTMNANIRIQQEQIERDLFAHLEEEMNRDDE